MICSGKQSQDFSPLKNYQKFHGIIDFFGGGGGGGVILKNLILSKANCRVLTI